MDLFSAEQLNGKLWNAAKLGAFLCFAVACGLLGASLILPDVVFFHAAYVPSTMTTPLP
jgi:hypothetical protein